MPFERVAGGFAFLVLVPFVILYLRRSKPLEQVIPSLMFFVKDSGVTRFHSFFQQLVRNLLFLLQLLILSLLAFSVMGFFADVSSFGGGRTVIVLDASASMQSDYGSSSRFEAAVGKALELVDGKVSIVLAANVPRVVLESRGAEEARSVLRSLKPLDTTSNLGDAILVAKELVDKGDIVVLSDFIATEGIDPFVARRSASRNARVRFFDFSGNVSNVGIVGVSPASSLTAVSVRNFNDVAEKVKVQVVNGNSLKDEAVLSLGAGSWDEFYFDTLPGLTEVKLVVDDGFKADNAAFVSVPDGFKARVLLITNADSSNVEAALSASSGIRLDVARPPVVNSFDYDVIVLSRFDPKLMLPGYYRDIERAVSNGSSVIIVGQKDLPKIGFLPVVLAGVGESSVNFVNVTNFFTDGVDFGVNEAYLTAKPKEGAVTLVSAGGSPVVALSGLGSGKVIYYGLLDDYSSFKSSVTYPVFWSRLVHFLVGAESLSSFNVKTGQISVVQKQNVGTPLGVLKADRVLFDKAGFYSYDGRSVAANLLSVQESSVSSGFRRFSEDVSSADVSVPFTETRHFDVLIAVFALLLVFVELLYVKFRGDF
ncbi:VWA domain-containing protein [Candidatus Woesearchaeota archaeon]|nr:VWA domain-containing protein [Candidatus Woesearchaeota archaeon]